MNISRRFYAKFFSLICLLSLSSQTAHGIIEGGCYQREAELLAMIVQGAVKSGHTIGWWLFTCR